MNPWLIDGAAVWAISVLRFPTGGRFNRAGQAPPVSRRHFRHLNRVSRGESHMRRLFSRVLAVLAITAVAALGDRKSTRLNSSHLGISYAVFFLKIKK